MQKVRDLPAQRCGIQEIAHRASIVEEFSETIHTIRILSVMDV
jgi:hypothetical protein